MGGAVDEVVQSSRGAAVRGGRAEPSSAAYEIGAKLSSATDNMKGSRDMGVPSVGVQSVRVLSVRVLSVRCVQS